MQLIKRNNGDFPTMPDLLSDVLDVERFFGNDWITNGWRSHIPSVNITENGNQFSIEVAIPGLTKDDVKISVDNGILTISAEKEEKKEEKDERYTRKEFSYNSFSRSFTLPDGVKEDDIKAKCESGILKLTLPKTEEAKKRAKKEIKVS